MDAVLIHTFLNVLAAESFVSAAEKMFVTQSAISIRIQKLEDLLGQQLFKRSKSGVELTSYGEQFEPFARSMLQLWDEAVYKISLPDGFDGNLSMACQDTLWPELSAVWLQRLTDKLPTTAFSFRTGSPQTLLNMLLRGVLDIAVVYNPEIRQGFKVEHIMDDLLVAVTADPHHTGELGKEYIFVDWGPEFTMAHSRWYPELRPPQLRMQVGAAIARFLIANGKAAYLPYRIADDYVAAGQLHFVEDCPRFPFPAFAVWTENASGEIMDTALQALRQAARDAPWIELGDQKRPPIQA